MELTHASFFSGVGGLDLGLERAGWRTVSFSEIDPYASAVLAQRWPGVPNLGDISALAAAATADQPPEPTFSDTGSRHRSASDWRLASLWSGGFPCQDLSVAGKRRGLAGERSGLAFAFLDLVERYRPPAILLENVPGLLSSHSGRDFYALQRRMAELGYVGAYRVLDAQYFGVPQRRRRVFIVALDARRGLGADSAAEVLSVGSRCAGHPPAGIEAGPGTAEGTPGRIGDLGPALTKSGPGVGFSGKDDGILAVIGAQIDPGGVRAADGLAGRLDDRGGVADGIAGTLNSGGNSGGFRTEPGAHLIATIPREGQRPHRSRSADAPDDLRSAGGVSDPSPLLPLGLDSHRYRCCGNGVVSSVAEWIGLRLAEALS